MWSETALDGPASPTRSNAWSLLALAGIGIALFLPHWLGRGTFIGDSDRLNTFLNIRKHTVGSLREHGSVSTWNDRMFCGYSTSGLHWMVPELDPFGYLQACLPEGSLFHVSGYISCLFLIWAGWAFFALARVFALPPFPSIVGGSLYMMSTFAINRIAQVDWAFAVLIAIPLGLAVLKQMRADNLTSSFLLLVATSTFLIVFTFLQEVAYVFLLFGFFAVHQSLRNRAWSPVLVFGLAFAVGFVLGLPRLMTVGEDFQEVSRTRAFYTTDPLELLRWFNDGIFGRYPEEALSIGNHVNLHEGVQLYSTTFAALLVLLGAIRFGDWSTLATRIALFGVLTMTMFEFFPQEDRRIWCLQLLGSWALIVLATARTRLLAAGLMGVLALGSFAYARAPHHYIVASYFSLLTVGLVWRRREQSTVEFSSRDMAFFYVFTSLCLAAILIPSARNIIYKLFFKVDFTHSRITIAALVPINLLLAHQVQCLFFRGDVTQPATTDARNLPSLAWGFAVGALALLGVIAGPAFWEWLSFLDGPPALSYSMYLFPRELFHLVTVCIVFSLLLAALFVVRHRPAPRNGLAYAVGLLLLGHCFANAFFQLAGPHTWNFPIPFRNNNYTTAPPQAFHDPTPEELGNMHRLLETEEFRTAFIAHPKDFYGFVEPSIADFWRLRVLGGYGQGVPSRLKRLPWHLDVCQLRSISFADAGMINWHLLALLNTKYVVLLDTDCYFNVNSKDGISTEGYDTRQMKVLKNPVDVMPRVFFTARATPLQPTSSVSEKEEQPLVKPAIHVTIDDRKAVRLEWHHPDSTLSVELEMREAKEATFRSFGKHPVAQRTAIMGQLSPGRYMFRCTLLRGERKFEASAETALIVERIDLSKPLDVKAERISDDQVRVTWAMEPDCGYILEKGEGRRRSFVQVHADAKSPVVVAHDGTRSVGFRVRAVQPGRSSVHSRVAWLAPAQAEPDDDQQVQALLPHDPRVQSVVEGFEQERSFSVAGTWKPHFQEDRVLIDVNPANEERFLVLNELYHPRWRATCDGVETKIFPVNHCMRGLVVPAGTTRIEFAFVPFSHSRTASAIVLLGLGLALAGRMALRRLARETIAPR